MYINGLTVLARQLTQDMGSICDLGQSPSQYEMNRPIEESDPASPDFNRAESLSQPL